MQVYLMHFPQYRKYENEKVYFKIVQPELWTEIQYLGSQRIEKSFQVQTFNDRNFVQDLLSCNTGIKICTELEFLNFYNALN